MTTEQHLDLIKAHCENLLEIAEAKRFIKREEELGFITSCANNAEAGWRTTIITIKSLRHTLGAYPILKQIIDAWPLELLQK